MPFAPLCSGVASTVERPAAGPRLLRRVLAGLAGLACALGVAAGSAQAQPGIVVIWSNGNSFYEDVHAISENGRWVAGTLFDSDSSFSRLYRYDTLTGTVIEAPLVRNPLTQTRERLIPLAVYNNGSVATGRDVRATNDLTGLGWWWNPGGSPPTPIGSPDLPNGVVFDLGRVTGLPGPIGGSIRTFLGDSRLGLTRGVGILNAINNGTAGQVTLSPTFAILPGMNITNTGTPPGGVTTALGWNPIAGYYFPNFLGSDTITFLAPSFRPMAMTQATNAWEPVTGLTIVGLRDNGAGMQVPARWTNGQLTDLPYSQSIRGFGEMWISGDGRLIVANALLNDPTALFGTRNQILVWRDGGPAQLMPAFLASMGIAQPTSLGFPPSAWGVGALTPDGTKLAGFAILRGAAPFVLTLAPTNDTCATARTVGYGTWADQTIGARRDLNLTCVPEGDSGDIFYRFQAPNTETVTIDTCGSDFNTTLQVFTAGNCNLFAPLAACNDDASGCAGNSFISRVSVPVSAGQEYFIRVAGWAGSRGNVRLNITAPARPTNDTCSGARVLQLGSRFEFNNINASTDPRPVCPSFVAPQSDVWFRVTATATGRIAFNTCGTSAINPIVPIMAVYGDGACGNLSSAPIVCTQPLGCPSGSGSTIIVDATQGQNFLIRVGSASGAQGGGFFESQFICDVQDFSAYSQAVASDEPLAHYRFDDRGNTIAANNFRSNANSCGSFAGLYTSVNPAITNLRGPGRDSLGLALPGNGSRVDRIFAPAPDPANSCGIFGDWTIEAWVNTSDPVAGVIATHRLDPSSGSPTLLIGYNPIGAAFPGRVLFVNDGPGNFTGAISNWRVDDGRWHHIVGVRSFDSLTSQWRYTIYVDGVLQGTNNFAGVGTRTPQFINGDNWWTIGNGPAWPVQDAAFNGIIDDVAIYCRILTQSRVTVHYNAGIPLCQPPVGSFAYRDLVINAGAQGYWRFEDTSTIARDDVPTFPPSGSCGAHSGIYSRAILNLNGGIYGNSLRPQTNAGAIAGVRAIRMLNQPQEQSIEAWVRSPQLGTAGTIFSSRGIASETGLSLSLGKLASGATFPNRLFFTVEGPSGESGVDWFIDSTFFASNVWHHIVAVRRATDSSGTNFEHILYVNGERVPVSENLGTAYRTQTLSTGGMLIGDRGPTATSTSMFAGDIDEVAFYPNVQAQTDVAARFFEATGGCRPAVFRRLATVVPPVLIPGQGWSFMSDIRSTRPLTYRWFANLGNGEFELTNGTRPDGVQISGATASQLNVNNLVFPEWQDVVIRVVADSGCGEAFDSVQFSLQQCDTLDFNNDGDFPTPRDLEDFINALAGNICGGCSEDLDFNNDGDFPSPLDVEAFISVTAGGPCF